MTDETESGDDALALVDFYEAFIRAGGSLSLGEWAIMDATHRAALVEAGNRVRRELVHGIALMVMRPDLAIDEDSKVRLALEKGVAVILAKMEAA